MSIRIAACLSVLLAASSAYAGSTKCSDGTSSTEKGRGTCSHHGGEKPSTPKNTESERARVPGADTERPRASETVSKTRAPTVTKTKATMSCNDGTATTATGRGSCAHHGGERAAEDVRASESRPAPSTREPADSHARVTKQAPESRPTETQRVPPESPKQPGAVIGHESAATGGTATARCRDGSLSYSQHHAGACSQHGGVAAWIDS